MSLKSSIFFLALVVGGSLAAPAAQYSSDRWGDSVDDQDIYYYPQPPGWWPTKGPSYPKGMRSYWPPKGDSWWLPPRSGDNNVITVPLTSASGRSAGIVTLGPLDSEMTVIGSNPNPWGNWCPPWRDSCDVPTSVVTVGGSEPARPIIGGPGMTSTMTVYKRDAKPEAHDPGMSDDMGGMPGMSISLPGFSFNNICMPSFLSGMSGLPGMFGGWRGRSSEPRITTSGGVDSSFTVFKRQENCTPLSEVLSGLMGSFGGGFGGFGGSSAPRITTSGGVDSSFTITG